MENTSISSPWVLYYRKLAALFREDPQIQVNFDEEKNIIKLYVDNADKAYALTDLLPREKRFGNVTVIVQVIPANLRAESAASLVRRAFDGNRAFSCVKEDRKGAYNLSYAVFKPRVVQYRSDDLGDINGLTSTLYQDIAKEILEDAQGIFFCTERVFDE